MLVQFFICSRPTNALHQFPFALEKTEKNTKSQQKKLLDLLASQHFWTLTIKKINLISEGMLGFAHSCRMLGV